VSRTSIGRDLKGAGRRKHREFAFSSEFFVGLTVGLVVAVGAFLWQQREIMATQTATIGQVGASSSSQSVIEPVTPDEAIPVFDFPKILVTREVIVDKRDGDVDLSTRPSTPILKPGAYVLHFGIFKDQFRAEQLQAKLQQLGIRPELQRIVIDNAMHYRVRMGPISDLGELNRTRALLNRSEVNSESIRVGE